MRAAARHALPFTLLLTAGGAVALGEKLHETAVIESLALAAPTFSGIAIVRITHPAGRGRFPVVVLSQGARSTPGRYGALAEHWAARGHVVIQPVPSELSPIGPTGARRVSATVEARIADLRFVLGALDQIETRARALRGKLDREHIAVAGHSTGALATLLAAGPRLVYVGDAEALESGDSSIDAVVLLGDPSRTGLVPDGAWRALDKPVLLVTGTNDDGEAPPGGARATAVFALGTGFASGPRHELFVRGMDVCLGGLLCRAAAGSTPDLAALSAIAETTTAFLRAYLRADAEAADWLGRDAPPDLANGRAQLSLR